MALKRCKYSYWPVYTLVSLCLCGVQSAIAQTSGNITSLVKQIPVGVDVSSIPNWNTVYNNFQPALPIGDPNRSPDPPFNFVIAEAWAGIHPTPGGDSPNAILQSISTNITLRAAYCELNFNDGSPLAPNTSQTGYWQVQQAISNIGDQLGTISFLAIAVENDANLVNANKTPGSHTLSKPEKIERIFQAVQAANQAGLMPIIYTSRDDWASVTDSNTYLGGNAQIPLWDIDGSTGTTIDTIDISLDFDVTPTSITPWVGYGGWTQRQGRQYALTVGNPTNAAAIAAGADFDSFSSFPIAGQYVPPTAVDITQQVAVNLGRLVYVRSTGLWYQRVTLTAHPGTSNVGPISLVLDGLTSAALFDESGNRVNTFTKNVAPLNSPYINVDIGDYVFEPQAPPQPSVVLQFNARPNYTHIRVLGGIGQR